MDVVLVVVLIWGGGVVVEVGLGVLGDSTSLQLYSSVVVVVEWGSRGRVVELGY